jgi:hypothetical protein
MRFTLLDNTQAGVILDQNSVSPSCVVPFIWGGIKNAQRSLPSIIRSSLDLKEVTLIPFVYSEAAGFVAFWERFLTISFADPFV